MDLVGYFITWVTYGTWLPGDQRGWIEYHRGRRYPDPIVELEAAARMTEDACRLSPEQRAAVEVQLAETCRHRDWVLHAVNCRSNHVHVIVASGVDSATKIRRDLKAWTTRCLKKNFNANRENWWAERGHIRYLYGAKNLDKAVVYVRDGQGLQRAE